jgi:hypothetical protein
VIESSTWLRREYVYINRALTLEQNKHAELRSELASEKKGFKAKINDINRKNYFYEVHNVIM